jgi:hypothetical protein
MLVYVRFAPKSGQSSRVLGMSALCQKRTHAPQQKNSQTLIGAAERARDFAERALRNIESDHRISLP